MTISINTTEDFIRALRDNADFRSAARRELLTEDLLEVPGQLVGIQKIQTSMLDEQRELRKTQTSMLDEQRELRNDSNALREAQNAILDTVATLLREGGEMRTDIRALHGMYRREHDDMQRFRGNYAFYAARKNRYQIIQLFARLRSMRRIRYGVLDSGALDTLLDENYEAVESLGLSDDALNSFPTADLVVKVAERRSSRPGFYVVAEASYTAQRGDVTRAAERARILRCATGLDSYAVVVSVRLAPNVEDIVFDNAQGYLASDDGSGAVWFPIVAEDMELPDPC